MTTQRIIYHNGESAQAQSPIDEALIVCPATPITLHINTNLLI